MASLAAVWGKNKPAAAADGYSRINREQSIGKRCRKVVGAGGGLNRGTQGEAQALGCLKEPRDGMGGQIRYLALRVARLSQSVNSTHAYI
jgi:hypothetical protein